MGGPRRAQLRGDDRPAGPLREALARELPFSSLELRDEAHASDGTVKALFATADGRPLEAVLMRYRDPGDGTGGVARSASPRSRAAR